MNEIKKRSQDINLLLKEALESLKAISYNKSISDEEFNNLFKELTDLRKIRIQSNQEDIMLFDRVSELHQRISSYQSSMVK